MSKRVNYLFVCAVITLHVQVINCWAQDLVELRYAPRELLVRFAPKARGIQFDAVEKNMILNSLGGATIEHNFKIVPGLSLVKLPPGQTVKDALQSYNSANGVLYAEPNYELKAYTTAPDDPCYVHLWGLNNVGQDPPGGTNDADIDAPEAWDIRTNADPNIIVAVIDSGVDYNHIDLADNMWINEVEKF